MTRTIGVKGHNSFTFTIDAGSAYDTIVCECGWERFYGDQDKALSEWNAHRVRASYSAKFFA